MPNTQHESKRAIAVIAAVLASFIVGAALDRKLDILPFFKKQLFPQSELAPLEITSDPNLRGYSSAEIVAAPPAEQFSEWQKTTRRTIIDNSGGDVLPQKTLEVTYRILEETQLASGIVRQLIAFKTFDQSEVPAYLHLPPGNEKLPAILVIPGHVKPRESGIEQTAILDDSYQHAAARKLAENGFVTLTPELRGFGYLGTPYGTEHALVAYNAILKGSSYKWMTLRDLGYAMRLLRHQNRVDANRTGVAGASLGGELAVNYAALDTEVKAVVFQSFGGRTGIKHAVGGDKDNQPHYCHVLPGVDEMVAQEHWLWLLAPRPTLGVRGTENRPFQQDAIATYRKGWQLAGTKEMPLFESAEGGHEFFVKPAVSFFKAEL